MGEPIWSRVTIKVPREWCWVDGDNEGSIAIGSDWWASVGGPLSEAVLAAASPGNNADEEEFEVAPDGDILITYAGEWHYGINAADGLAPLREWNIPFEAHEDPKYEYSGHMYYFDPTAGVDAHGPADADGNVIITDSDVKGLLDDAELLQAFCRERFSVSLTFNLAACSVEHLRALPDDDEHDVEGVPMFIKED